MGVSHGTALPSRPPSQPQWRPGTTNHGCKANHLARVGPSWGTGEARRSSRHTARLRLPNGSERDLDHRCTHRCHRERPFDTVKPSVRVDPHFFSELDPQLGETRGPDGERSVSDSLLVELPTLSAVFSERFDDLPAVYPIAMTTATSSPLAYSSQP